MNQSICKSCRYRLDTWSEKLRSTHDGCGYCIRTAVADDDSRDFALDLTADFTGFGWVTNGFMAVNSQPITQGVKECPKYITK